jgi:flagellar biosynthesis anti-sigma factor FlgM
MKIEPNGPQVDAGALQRLDRAATDEQTRATTARTTKQGDRVELSSDAAVAAMAVKAANETPEIRAELVEEMRRLMKSGDLGKDAGALADSLIDTITGGK